MTEPFDSVDKRLIYTPKYRSLCEKDPWYYYWPLSDSHRLKCSLNVTLERKGREDISCSYQWETSKLDWWLAANVEQIQLNEFAFRLKLLTWRHRRPFLTRGCDIPEFNYHWVRPGSEQEEDIDEELEKATKTYPSKPFEKFFTRYSSLFIFGFIILVIAILVYFNDRH